MIALLKKKKIKTKLQNILAGTQTVITGGYWLKSLTTNCLGGYCILPTATTNRLGRSGYFYNRRLAIIE